MRRMALTAALAMPCSIFAQGFMALPADGFPVKGGTSAYTLCHAASNFGARPAPKAAPGVNDRCALFPANNAASPLPGFSLLATDVHPVILNNSLTGNTNMELGNVREYVWRNAAATECIFGTQLTATLGNTSDYDAGESDRQYLRISDIARGGFNGLPVAVAYSALPLVAKPLYRVGRTFTAVQYRGGRKGPAAGYAAQPLATPDYRLAINGIDNAAQGVPTPQQQSASLNDNWVTFTTLVTALDDDGWTSAASGTFYVKSPCTAEKPQQLPGSIRLRQTDSPFIEISVPGFVPPNTAMGTQP